VFSTDDILHIVDDSVASWQVLYTSSSASGEPVVVSATVLAPRAASGASTPSAIIAYDPGATGMGDACAPSRQIPDGTFVEDGILKDALDRGWALVVMDYPGLGTPGDHPYSVNRALAYATLDGVRAALSIAELGLSRATPVGVWGYSEGGGAAVATAELAPSYAPELNLVGAAAGGVSSDLLQNAAALEGQLTFVPSVLMAIGYNAAYPELALDGFLTARGKRELSEVRDKCIIDAMLQFAYGHISDYTVRSPFDDPGYRQRMAENRLGQFAPRIPVYLYHAQNDEAVPLRIALALRDTYCAMGVTTTFQTLSGTDHLGGQAGGYPAAADWLAERFAGLPAHSTCATR
jgi:pimeloyl-ACP methyl ester carboxylesterase